MGFWAGIKGEPVAAEQDFHFRFVAGLARLCRVRDGFGVFKKDLLAGRSYDHPDPWRFCYHRL